MNLIDSAAGLEQRRLKFFENTSARITSDPLSDNLLVSRGSDLRILPKDQTSREQLLSRIKKLQDERTFEQGLRKLRELIIMVFDEN